MLDFIDPKILSAMGFTFVAGLSTAIGGLIVIFNGQPTFTKLGHMLSFSTGVMLYLSFMDLMPEAVAHSGYITANLWMFGGMAFFELVSKFVPEPDVSVLTGIDSDHSHSHSGDSNKKDDDKKKKDSKDDAATKQSKEEAFTKRKQLLSVGVMTAIGISLHNFPEGIAVYLACLRGMELGLPLTCAIAIHNIPEGMAVASPIYHATGSKWLAFKYSLLSGICEPVGAILVGVLFQSFLTDYYVHCMLAAVAGIMILICFKELIPTTFKYIGPEQAVFSNIFGMIVVMFGVYWLHGSIGQFHGHDHSSGGCGHDSHEGHDHSGHDDQEDQ